MWEFKFDYFESSESFSSANYVKKNYKKSNLKNYSVVIVRIFQNLKMQTDLCYKSVHQVSNSRVIFGNGWNEIICLCWKTLITWQSSSALNESVQNPKSWSSYCSAPHSAAVHQESGSLLNTPFNFEQVKQVKPDHQHQINWYVALKHTEKSETTIQQHIQQPATQSSSTNRLCKSMAAKT